MSIQKTLYRDGPYAALFSQGVQVGNTLHMAGQVGTDASGKAPESLVEQMKNAYGHVESVLKEFDSTMDNVVEETWFVTDMHECMTQVQELFAARQAIYGKPPEVAQTLVQVVALVDPSLKIEIKCVAITD